MNKTTMKLVAIYQYSYRGFRIIDEYPVQRRTKSRDHGPNVSGSGQSNRSRINQIRSIGRTRDYSVYEKQLVQEIRQESGRTQRTNQIENIIFLTSWLVYTFAAF